MPGSLQPGAFVDGLPTLQCLLQLCDIGCLSKEVIKEFALRDTRLYAALSSKSNRRRARARVVASIQEMRTLGQVSDALDEWVLAPVEQFYVEGGRPHIVHRTRMLLVKRRPGGAPHADCLRDIAGVPWGCLLAVGVNWRGSWSCCDRYRALASIVWDMTREGFSAPENKSTPTRGGVGAQLSLQQMVELQNSLLVPSDYHAQYARRLAMLAGRMNDCALEDFFRRVVCA